MGILVSIIVSAHIWIFTYSAYADTTTTENNSNVENEKEQTVQPVKHAQKRNAKSILDQYFTNLKHDMTQEIKLMTSKYQDELNALQITVKSEMIALKDHIRYELGLMNKSIDSLNQTQRLIQNAPTPEKDNQYAELIQNEVLPSIENIPLKIDKVSNTFQQLIASIETGILKGMEHIEIKRQNEWKDQIEHCSKQIISLQEQTKNDSQSVKDALSQVDSRLGDQIAIVKTATATQMTRLNKEMSELLKQDIKDSISNQPSGWLIYLMLITCMALIGFIIWERLFTIRPIIRRIKQLEENLVL